MTTISMAGIRPEQGPPLHIPLSFFFVAPMAMAIAAIASMVGDGGELSSVWSGPNAALAHLGALGLLMTTMLGSWYQLSPVVAGVPVPHVRLSHAVQALVVAGAASLVIALWTGVQAFFAVALSTLSAGLAIFWGPAAWALWRTRATGPTVAGMRLALIGLALVAVVGVRMAWARATTGYPAPWVTWRWAHAHLGLLAWVGCLTSAVSWQVVPMFHLTPPPHRLVTVAVRGGVALTAAWLISLFLLDAPSSSVALAILPGALAVWVLQPAWVAWAIVRRRRKRRDPSLYFWWLAVLCAPLSLAAAVFAELGDWPNWPAIYGWLVLWGWASAMLHGMLARIVPFLVWLHRCSARVGLEAVPSTRELWTDRAVAAGFALHALTLVAGLVAAATESTWAWRVAGGALLATALRLGWSLGAALGRAPPLPPGDLDQAPTSGGSLRGARWPPGAGPRRPAWRRG